MVIAALGLFLLISLSCLIWFQTRSRVDPLQSGRDAYARGDWEAAYNAARSRLKQVSGDREAIRLLARASVQLGRDTSAMALYDQLGQSAMEADDLYLLGKTLARTGNSKGSVEVWKEGLKETPDHSETLFEMIRVHLAAERFDAGSAAAQALARHPDWKDRADVLMGWIELGRENPARAVELWQPILARGPGPVPLVTGKDLVRALLRLERPAEARNQLQSLLANGPDPEASWLLSRAYLQEKSLEKARAAYEAAGSFSDENPTLHEPAPLTGAASCAHCHAKEYKTQQSSRHARTFYHMSEIPNLAIPAATVPDPAVAGVSHRFQRTGGQIEQTTQTPKQEYKAVFDYAFGSGDRGKTMVGHDESGQSFELRLSLYLENTPKPVWDLTSGHAPQAPADQAFLGMPLTKDSVRRCFSCHVTSPRRSRDPATHAGADHGIGCELCHGPGGNHLLAVEMGFPDLAIARPSIASGAQVVKICAFCHSPRGKTVEPDDPTAVRSQGTTLTWSRCYAESQDRLGCATCHDPHRNVETDARYYELKCLACHSASKPPASKKPEKPAPQAGHAQDDFQASICPVNSSGDCITCHMPRVEGVVPHSTFTDHFIRVHRESPTSAHN